ncbi:MAG: DNA polymerase IV, partial [Clostridia bacterium]
MERVIYHIDCNAFYASVECLDRPELHRVPLAVAGDPKERSGIILAKNEIAKRYGVKTAETIWQAKRKCPGLVLVPPRHERYQEVSRSVKALFG